MRHWKGWADAKTLNQSKHTPSWFEIYEASSWNWYHPWLKSQGVVMVMHDEFKYQPCPTIHYTYNEMLEGSSWCELPESVQSHTILVWIVDMGQAKFVPAHDSKMGWGWPFHWTNSNLNLVWPFNILLMWHWKGQADVKCLNQPKYAPYWFET